MRSALWDVTNLVENLVGELARSDASAGATRSETRIESAPRGETRYDARGTPTMRATMKTSVDTTVETGAPTRSGAGTDARSACGTSTTTQPDLGWLRPLAILCAELEHAVRFGHDDELALAVCRDLSTLLDGVGCTREFAARYSRELARRKDVALLHLRIVRACRSAKEAARVPLTAH